MLWSIACFEEFSSNKCDIRNVKVTDKRDKNCGL